MAKKKKNPTVTIETSSDAIEEPAFPLEDDCVGPELVRDDGDAPVDGDADTEFPGGEEPSIVDDAPDEDVRATDEAPVEASEASALSIALTGLVDALAPFGSGEPPLSIKELQNALDAAVDRVSSLQAQLAEQAELSTTVELSLGASEERCASLEHERDSAREAERTAANGWEFALESYERVDASRGLLQLEVNNLQLAVDRLAERDIERAASKLWQVDILVKGRRQRTLVLASSMEDAAAKARRRYAEGEVVALNGNTGLELIS